LTAPRAALAAALALAAASLALPYLPVYDPWAWLVWGRELLHGGLETATGPSWKPLPVLIDAPLSLLGDAAPQAWLLIARSGWIAAPLLAGLLAARLTGEAAGRWRVAAALVAGASVALTGDDFTPPLRQFTGGLSEPLLVALVLGAVWAALDEHPGRVLGLGAAAALLRPECWPFLALWALFAARAERRLRPAAILVAVLVPLAWFVPDIVGAGTPLEGSETAREGGLEPIDALEVLGRTLLAPLAAAWIGLALLPFVGSRLERSLRVLLAGAVAWVAVVAAMAVAGYAGLPRFLAPATAAFAIAGGVGLARAGAAAFAPGSRRPALAAAVAAALALALGGFALRAAEVPGDVRTIEAQTESLEDLFDLADRVGSERLLSCGGAVRVTQLLSQTALAWKLDQQIAAVPVRRHPLYGIVLNVRPIPGAVVVAQAGRWRATRLPCPSGYEPYRPGGHECRPREAPGTVGGIGEDVAGGAVRVHDFVACFGPPLRRFEMAGRRCLYYRQRGLQTYWRFCVRDGRIVSALGSLPRAG
jgi:hypothetical protein